MTNEDRDARRAEFRLALDNIRDVQLDLQRLLGEGKTIVPKADFEHVLEYLVPSDKQVGPLPECSLERLSEIALSCQACKLSATRHSVVFGEGKLQPLAMVVGEGPGADEDASGRPFVGRAGQYLDRWLASIGLSRQINAYIANIVKCRPPGNRDPEADEVEACLPYLKRQVELIQPRSILCLGRTAAHTLLSSTDSIQQMRSRWYRFDSIPVLVTYHPSAVLRNPDLRAAVWEDLKRLAAFLKIDIPAKAR
jgi:DNA polymerase